MHWPWHCDICKCTITICLYLVKSKSLIVTDCRNFTDTALSFSMTILNAVIDLVSFSEILYTIYPPLFVVLVVYSVGGTGISIKLGQKLVGLNFQQEAQEANFRYISHNHSPRHLLVKLSKVLHSCSCNKPFYSAKVQTPDSRGYSAAVWQRCQIGNTYSNVSKCASAPQTGLA